LFRLPSKQIYIDSISVYNYNLINTWYDHQTLKRTLPKIFWGLFTTKILFFGQGQNEKMVV